MSPILGVVCHGFVRYMYGLWERWNTTEKPFKSVMVWYITCMACESDKIQLRSHSSLSWFGTSRAQTVRTIKCDWRAIQVLWTFHTLRVRTVSVEGSLKWGNSGLDDEENVTDIKKRETNEGTKTRLVNLCHSSSHFGNGTTCCLIKYDWQAIQVLWKFRMLCVQIVSVERSMKWEEERLRQCFSNVFMFSKIPSCLIDGHITLTASSASSFLTSVCWFSLLSWFNSSKTLLKNHLLLSL